MTEIVFFLKDLGRTRVPRGGSEEPGLGWFGGVGDVLALRSYFHEWPQWTRLSPWLADDMVDCKKII